MELIQKALEKAKANATTAARTNAADPQAQPVTERAKPPVAAGGVPTREAHESIVYSKTRVFSSNSAHWNRFHIVATNVQDGAADVFRMLRTKVLQEMREHDWRSLAIGGATPGVGKTTIAANLAMSIALDSNQTVLLIDLDLRRPKLATYLGFEPVFGLGDYLEEKATLDQVLVNPGIERLVVLPSKNSHANSAELLGSRRMTNLVQELKSRYADRILIFDLPPLLSSSDALSFMPHIDCALLVVENGGNTADQVSESRRLLGEANLIGWVLNKGEEKRDGYYY